MLRSELLPGVLNAVRELVSQLSPGFNAAIFILLHLSKAGIGEILVERIKKSSPLGLSLCATAREKEKLKDKDVPAAVQTTFKAEFPEAKDIEWKMKDGHYKVGFEENGANHIASLDSTGKLLSKGIEIKESELPDVYKVEKDGSINYLVKLNGDPETKILYAADGQVIKEK